MTRSGAKTAGRRKLGRRLLLFTFLTLPPFLLAELFLRFFLGFGDLPPGNLDLRPDGLPNWPEHRSVALGGDRSSEPLITYNRFGFRGPEWKLERSPGTERAVLVGDSFTFGRGVSDQETLAHHLETERPGMEVMNLGISGLNTHQERLLVEEWLPRLKPDYLILVIYLNDTESLHCNPPVVPECLPPTTAAERTYGWALENVYLFRALNFLVSENRCRGPQECPNSLVEGTLQRRCFLASLRAIAQVARENEARLLAVHYPNMGYEWLPGGEAGLSAPFARELELLLAREGIDYLDLIGPFTPHGGRSLKVQVTRNDGHPNGKANEIAARALLERLPRPEGR